MSDVSASNNLSTPYDRHHGLTIDHEPTSAVAIIEGTMIAIIFLGSLVVNSLALTSILRDKLLRTNLHNWLILNLIINDLGLTVTSMSFVVVSVFDHGRFLIHNESLCLFSGTCAILFAFGNFSTVLAISVDRYLAVVWSSIFPQSRTRTVTFIVLCWVVPILNAIPPSFGMVTSINYQSVGHYCTADWEENCLYFVTCVTIIFGVTVPVMAFCYISVFWSVRRQQRLLRSHVDKKTVERLPCSVDYEDKTECPVNEFTSRDEPETLETHDVSKSSNDMLNGPANDGDRCELAEVEVSGQENIEERTKTKDRRKRRAMQRKLSMEKRIALTGTLLVMTTVVCWSPYCVVNPCLIPASSTPHWLSVSTVWLAYANALLDPLIYSFMNRRVRARYGAVLRRLFKGCPTGRQNEI